MGVYLHCLSCMIYNKIFSTFTMPIVAFCYNRISLCIGGFFYYG